MGHHKETKYLDIRSSKRRSGQSHEKIQFNKIIAKTSKVLQEIKTFKYRKPKKPQIDSYQKKVFSKAYDRPTVKVKKREL